MKVMLEYYCRDCGESHERFLDPTIMTSRCECGELAHKSLSYPKVLNFRQGGKTFPMGIDGDKWAKTREEKARKTRERDT